MSILIRGIEMPKDHVRVLVLHPDGRAIDEWGNTYQASLLPEHGDLIDRDDLKWKRWLMQWEEEDGEIIKRDIVLWGDIMSSPTIIPAEEASK